MFKSSIAILFLILSLSHQVKINHLPPAALLQTQSKPTYITGNKIHSAKTTLDLSIADYHSKLELDIAARNTRIVTLNEKNQAEMTVEEFRKLNVKNQNLKTPFLMYTKAQELKMTENANKVLQKVGLAVTAAFATRTSTMSDEYDAYDQLKKYEAIYENALNSEMIALRNQDEAAESFKKVIKIELDSASENKDTIDAKLVVDRQNVAVVLEKLQNSELTPQLLTTYENDLVNLGFIVVQTKKAAIVAKDLKAVKIAAYVAVQQTDIVNETNYIDALKTLLSDAQKAQLETEEKREANEKKLVDEVCHDLNNPNISSLVVPQSPIVKGKKIEISNHNILFYVSPGNLSYNDSIKFVKNLNGRLPSQQEVKYLLVDYYGQALFNDDIWIPVSGGANNWVSVGNYDIPKRLGNLHQILGGKPVWGPTRQTHNFRKIIGLVPLRGTQIPK